MKKSILLILLLIVTVSFSQTTINLSGMTSDLSLGQNCSQSQTPLGYVTNGNSKDLNLNGKTLNLRNVKLIVLGNINGPGIITYCGQSNIVLQGVIQNNPNLNNIPINVNLDLQDFNMENIKYYEDLKIYDFTGKYITNNPNIEELDSGGYILTAKGRKSIKIYKLK